MRVQVKPLRQRGARRSDYDIQAMSPFDGGLTVYGPGATIQLTLSAPDDQQAKPLLPSLYDARLVTMNGAKMLFAGLERTADPLAAQYLQEWSVVIIAL